jgi:ABC-2 type transport system permease protein
MTRGWWAMTWLVARRELRARTRARSARIFSAILLVAVAAAVVIPALVSGGGAKRVGVVGPDRAALARTVQLAGRVLDAKLKAVPLPDAAAGRARLRDGSLDAVLVGGREVLVKQRSAAGVNSADDTAARVLAQLAATGGKLPQQPAALPVRGLEPPPPSLAPRLTGMGVVILIYLLIFVYGQRIAQGVGDEKQSRVVEVLLATLRPTQLLTGKVIGIGLVALAQVAAALAVFLLLGWAVGSDLVRGVSGGVVAIGALWFVLGYAFYCTAFAAAGSLLSRASDAGNVAFPIAIPLIAAYGISFSVLFGHASGFYRVLGFLPPTAPVAMPTLYAVGAASAAGIVVSAAITVAATIAMSWLGGLIYQRAIMRTGERVRLAQVLGRRAART